MARRKKQEIKVKVVARGDRGKYVFRWKDREGDWHQENSEIEIGGPSATAERKSRNAAERAAVVKQAELNALPTDEEGFAPNIAAYIDKVRGDGASATHYEIVSAQLTRFAKEARDRYAKPLESVRSITEDVVVGFIAGLKRILRPRKSRKVATYKRNLTNPPPPPPPLPPPTMVPASQQTKNHYLTSIKAFCSFLTARGFFEKSPAAKLTRPSPHADLRHARRALAPEEFSRLIQAAAAGKVIEGIDGKERAMLYIIAAYTGYRRKELASLTLRSLSLDGPAPCVRVKSRSTKNAKEASIPLHPSVAGELRTWLQSRGDLSQDAPIFALRGSGGDLRKTSKMMRRDLEAAKLPYQDENGLFADFHANRATFITRLIESGVHIFRAQLLARHGDPKTTAIYSKATDRQLLDEVGKLPAAPSLERPNPPAAPQPPATDSE